MAKVTEYGRKIKLSLMDAGKTQTWLISEVQKETGLYFDDSYLYRIMYGTLRTPKIIAAINRILGIGEERSDGLMPAKWTGELVAEIHNAGLTIKEVAEAAGMNPKYISTVLNSDGGSPKAEAKLRSALNRLKGNCEQDSSVENGICGVGSACGGLTVKSMSDVWRDFLEIAADAGMTDGDIYSDNMMCVAYRLYLEGVQDGMKGDVKKKDE
jgi:hypothetical protein